MGKLSYDPVIQHFSHPHPLELVQLDINHVAASPCSSCKLKASGWIYTCRPCSYVLHISCAQMPQIIRHAFHPDHPLSLLPLPAYPQGFFNCDACGRRGEGFSYHCSACDVDIHTLCAAMPLSISHHTHHHPLALTFYPPYENKGFSCDICTNLGSNHWLYRCSACEFDAHMSCATANPKPPMLFQQHQNQQPQMPLQVSNRQPQMPLQVSNQQIQAPGSGMQFRQQQGYAPNYGFSQGGQPAAGGDGQGNSMADQAVQEPIDTASQQAEQNFIQIITGGDGGGTGGGGGDDSSSGSFFSRIFDRGGDDG